MGIARVDVLKQVVSLAGSTCSLASQVGHSDSETSRR